MEEQGKDISHEFPITFCQRIEAVLALMHVRPMFEIMTADNSMLRGEAMQPGNQRKALLARINLPQIKAQNHLADMVRKYIYILRSCIKKRKTKEKKESTLRSTRRSVAGMGSSSTLLEHQPVCGVLSRQNARHCTSSLPFPLTCAQMY